MASSTESPGQVKKRKRDSAGHSAAVMACQQVWVQASRAVSPLVFPFPSFGAAVKFRTQMYNSVRHIRDDPMLDETLAKAWEEVEIVMMKPEADGSVALRIGRKLDSQEGQAILEMLRNAGCKVDSSALLRSPKSEAVAASAARVSRIQELQEEVSRMPQPVTISELHKSLPQLAATRPPSGIKNPFYTDGQS